ncbi:MobF family relaxase [Enterobacter hormaechei]|uniref:MobF family relaxase n=2 Tax=Enterobacteriaceae TaxID=543 RepID=UPI0013D3A27C|nr:MobF family relaxase [Enterobacter hormaechei]EDK1561940.1 conjugal transfer protein TraI [Salmonella enterica subsp. enterica serovar Newport]
MLSLAKVENTKKAGTYYNSPDKYYDKDTGENGSVWGGKGAELLNLRGEVSNEDFVRLLEGRINPETHLGKIGAGGVIEHVPAWDFTLSAPKSLSVLALVGGDKRLIEAHLESVKEAMAFVEKEYALTRVSNNGNTEYQKVDNLVYASFLHTESRKHDPQLHSHSVVLNAVMDSNGQWRSLETKKMFEAQLAIGMAYRSFLAKKVVRLGYDIELRDEKDAEHKHGFWDIKGVSESLLTAFSKRRAQVLENANQYGLFDAKSMEKAALYSRDTKTEVPFEELKQIWDETVALHGVNLDSVIDRAIERQKSSKAQNLTLQVQIGKNAPHDLTGASEHAGGITQRHTPDSELTNEDDFSMSAFDTNLYHKEDGHTSLTPKAGEERLPGQSLPTGKPSDEKTFIATEKMAREYLDSYDFTDSDVSSLVNEVRLAYRVKASDEAVFLQQEVLNEAMRLTLGRASMDDIQNIFRAMINSGELLPRTSRQGDGGPAFTTPAAFEKEREMVFTMMNGKQTRPAVGDKEGIVAWIAHFETEKSAQFGSPFAFSPDQRQAIIDAASSQDLVSAIQGFAGTGKTTLLQCLIGYGKTKGYDFLGLAPTGSATETLTNETGIKASTVDSFLYRRMRGTVSNREVWLVDEASLVGANNMHALVKEAERSGAKLLLLGDVKQMEAVDWGRPFSVLQGFKMQTSKVETIIRQKNEDLRQAVYDSIDGRFGLAFERIKDSVFNSNKHSILEDYLALPESERLKTLVIIPDNEGRHLFNEEVHQSRIKKGELPSTETKVRGLFSANLNEAERTDHRYYKINQIVEFQQDHEGFAKGEFWKVSGRKDGKLVLRKDGQEALFNPTGISGNAKFAVDVFDENPVRFAQNEKVVFTKSRKDLGVKNGDEFTLTHIDQASKTFTLVNEAGKSLTLESGKLQNLSHNYALTAYKAQGKTVDRVMAKLESWRRNLVNERSFYVGLSRARQEARLYVNNVGKVIEALHDHEASKTTSLTGFSVKSMQRAASKLHAGETDTRQLYSDITQATEKLALKHGVFSHTALLTETLKNTLGTYDIRDVEGAIYNLRQRGDIGLSYVNHDKPNRENFYTLPQNIRHETQIVRHMLQGKDRYAAIAGKSIIERYLSARDDKVRAGLAEPVSAATKSALMTVMTSRDEAVLITGSDLSGHREVMRELGKDIAKERGYRVRGFSTTAEGVKQLREYIKSSGNIYQHLDTMEQKISSRQTAKSGKELWVVENVSQMGAENVIRLQQAARYVGARVVMVADRQENALTWGNMPSLLTEQGIKNIDFDQANRSLNPAINYASEKITQGKVEEALKHISPMVSEVTDPHNATNDRKVRLNVLADTWLNLAATDRDKTAIVIPDYFSRNKVDVQIRKGLQSEGKLAGSALDTKFYRNANLDPFEKKSVVNYKEGQVLMFESQRPGIDKGGYYTVEGIDKAGNILMLRSVADGGRVSINAAEIAGSRNNSVQVFHVDNKQVQRGEKLRFTRSIPADKLESGDGKSVPSKSQGVVESIDGTKLNVRLANQRMITVDTEKWKHMEWGYTYNMFNIKDRQFDNVITLMESQSRKNIFATQESLHNALTKASVNLRIVTDNKAKLFDNLRSTPGFRQTALQDRKVSISKNEMAQFDKQFGTGLGFGSRTLLKLEAAVDKAVSTTLSKIVEKTKDVGQKTKQKTL